MKYINPKKFMNSMKVTSFHFSFFLDAKEPIQYTFEVETKTDTAAQYPLNPSTLIPGMTIVVHSYELL